MPAPHPPALRWIVCPSAQLASGAWLVAARRARWQLVLADLTAVDLVQIAGWASRVRAAGLIAGVRVDVAAVTRELLNQAEACGPLVVAVHPGAGTALDWQRCRALLATGQWPRLRFAAPEAPACLVWPLRTDVALAPGRPRWSQEISEECAACARMETCSGPVHHVPPARFARTLSNQFDLTQTDGDGEVRLQTADGLVSFSAGSVPEEIVARARTEGQIYLDVSDKARLDDFAADLALLVQRPEGTWQRSDVAPFAREEADILAELQALTGLVVDVGAGPIRYVQELARAQQEGLVRYVAVEPEWAALERTTAMLPDALALQGTGEALPLATGSADVVLMLRSFNHLHSVGRALREVVRVLRPGGKFVACDNVVFGLCRTRAQVARAHAIAVDETPFEHFRNANVDEMVAAITAEVPGTLRITRADPVGPGRSNQWLLVATRLP